MAGVENEFPEIQSLNADKVSLNEEQGKVSYVYRKEVPRPAFVFEKSKNDAASQGFITIVYPYEENNAPEISILAHAGNDLEKGNLNISLTINGTKQEIKVKLNP
ncbi:hypothetical protein [Pedobacter caeni]|uniref:Heparan-sulfate lyase n=1 Tax=Pedobacter caeni TaxID=288992 RepID=A0A1M5KRH4_9SPHI|nr:hypothetical protein [Pedobacter caeni]SHG55316.1 heparan-sulfate lyase [Pedobacter caeni]